jgi:hypothetical protein
VNEDGGTGLLPVPKLANDGTPMLELDATRPKSGSVARLAATLLVAGVAAYGPGIPDRSKTWAMRLISKLRWAALTLARARWSTHTRLFAGRELDAACPFQSVQASDALRILSPPPRLIGDGKRISGESPGGGGRNARIAVGMLEWWRRQ